VNTLTIVIEYNDDEPICICNDCRYQTREDNQEPCSHCTPWNLEFVPKLTVAGEGLK
jgi:hypothetical protein